MKRSAAILISAGTGLVLLSAGTAAGAAIAGGPVDGSGVIYGCFTTRAASGLHALVLQDVGTTCPSGTTAIRWNQQGPQGPAGPKGDTGAQGPAGTTGTAGPMGAAGPAGPIGAAGPAGPMGAAGPAGPTGAVGPAGADGNTVLNGSGTPQPSLGKDGDFYLDTAAAELYGPKANGAWPADGVSLVGSPGATGPAGLTGPPGPQGMTGPQGPSGADGNTVLNGTGTPQPSLGKDGDFYLNTGAAVLYGPKANGAWPAAGTSLTGSPGAPGKDATVSALAAGNANCPNGGAAITDGSGHTAFACTGATGPSGSVSTQTFSADATQTVGFPPGGSAVTVPGMTARVTPTAQSTYFVSANLYLITQDTGSGTLICRPYVDGAPADNLNPTQTMTTNGTASLTFVDQIAVGAGTHTFDVRCQGFGTIPVYVVNGGMSVMNGFKLN